MSKEAWLVQYQIAFIRLVGCYFEILPIVPLLISLFFEKKNSAWYLCFLPILSAGSCNIYCLRTKYLQREVKDYLGLRNLG